MSDKDNVKTDGTSKGTAERGGKIYVIKRDDFELWCDPKYEQRINQFNDNDGFILEGADIEFRGNFFKSRNFREVVLDSIRWRNQRRNHPS